MEIRLLGPVELELGDRPATLGGPKQRAVLSLLALTANTTVSVDRLIEGLWGEDQPASAAKMVQLYVSQLRKLLRENGGAEIVTHGRGYELRLDPDAVDAARFERLIAEASRGRDNGGATEAAPRALALWRGPPLADLIDEPFAMAEARRLEALRLAALELAIESDLDAGRHREVSGRLDSLVAEHPLRERLHGLRMLALYRAGRQAEALEAYGAARAELVEQVGAEPGPDLRRLHEAILRQDPALELAAPELPPELTPEPPVLGGRAAEHERLRSAWRAARAGAGRVLLVYGRGGVGKTRLVAELAREVQAERASVVYVGGAGPAAGTTLREARRTVGPALIVFDDLDRAPAEIVECAGEVAGAARASLLIVLAYCDDPLSATVSHLARELEARGALHDLEAELASNVVDLHTVREKAERYSRARRQRPDGGDDGGLPVCPFKGLASYEVSDADYFSGRDQLIAEMVARLAGAGLLGVVGPSGSGKSSAVRAGLLPALAGGVLPGSERWQLALLRPGEHPLRALEHATAESAPQGGLVVAVDQFEEVFTACHDESERAAFVDALVAWARDPRRRAVVLVAVRADFYGRCAAYPELSRLLGANHVLVGPMRRDELRRAIELPARRAGLHVEPELVDVLAADVEGEPGALPLLSTSLLELWQERDGRLLRLGDYRRAGGVHGAVARLAEH